jgi:hypothetical protein
MGTMMMMMLSMLFVVAIGVSAAADAAAYTDDDGDRSSTTSSKFDNLVAWLRHNGGRVDTRLGLTYHHKHHHHHHGDRSVAVRGGVALQHIDAGTELLFLPWKIVFGTINNTAEVPENKCQVLQSYAAEVDAGHASFWYPYLALDDSLSSRVPSLWGELAIAELQGLPPYDVGSSRTTTTGGGGGGGLTEWYMSNCCGAANDVSFGNLPSSSRQALLAAITRAAGLRFLPVYDLLNHHNGLVNVQSFADREGDTITTTVDIQKGEEIFISYRGGQENTVDEMFRRYGFVEEWPRYYSWKDQREDDDESNHGDGDGDGPIQFLILPCEIVAIYPPTSMLSQIGLNTLNVDDLLAQTEKHNQGLSAQQLIYFNKVGVGLMSMLNTTVEEDTMILQKMNDNLVVMSLSQDLLPPAGEEEIEQLMDIISAIYYRIQFKQSIRMALDATNQVLALRNDKDASSEL